MTVAAVVLAAGASRRLGRPKQTLALGQGTVLGTTLAVARRSRPERVVEVLGGAADYVRQQVDLTGVEVTNRFYEIGSPEGIRDTDEYLRGKGTRQKAQGTRHKPEGSSGT